MGTRAKNQKTRENSWMMNTDGDVVTRLWSMEQVKKSRPKKTLGWWCDVPQ